MLSSLKLGVRISPVIIMAWSLIHCKKSVPNYSTENCNLHLSNMYVFCLHRPSVLNMNFENIMFTNHIVLKSGTLGVYKQNTFGCSISVTIFSVVIWDTCLQCSHYSIWALQFAITVIHTIKKKTSMQFAATFTASSEMSRFVNIFKLY